MEYRSVGLSGLKVSPLCIGTMIFRDAAGEREAEQIVDLARESGVNFIDTADSYAQGDSERIVGRIISRDRENWVLATKVGSVGGKEPFERGLSRRWMLRAIDRSLKRLGTDYVDIWYMHMPDHTTPLEESISAMGDVIADGKVTYWGFSNYRGWQVGEIISLCDALGVPRPIICQPLYNALNRTPETDLLPACDHYGIAVAPYSPIARGVLTGKYELGKKPPEGTRAHSGDQRIHESEYRDESIVIAKKIKAYADARGMTSMQYAILWLLNNAIIASIVAGPRTLEQWREYVGALDFEFTSEDEAFLEQLVPAGHPSTPGFTDPRYAYTGRVTLTG
jgi:aryl-alcohol dehydrogenase-like predicted oxidoreductase